MSDDLTEANQPHAMATADQAFLSSPATSIAIEFDPAKDALNSAIHGLSLAEAVRFDLMTAAIVVDDRRDYGETRFRAFQRFGKDGYSLVFTVRGAIIRPISLRRAHQKDMRRYGR